jgi:segregation and condensation protein B
MSAVPEPRPESSPEKTISLDELAAAYAQSMGVRAGADSKPPEESGEADLLESAEAPDVEAEAPAQSRETEADALPAPPADDSDDDDPCPICPRTLLEAMLFVGNHQNEPLTSARAAELMRGVSPEEIPSLVDELNAQYAARGSPYRIASEGAGYRISLRGKYHGVRDKFYGRIREARLSQAAVDVLAIVAYRQPILGEEVSRLRGKPSAQLLSQLVRRELLQIERPPGKRRPVSYRTTARFLELFGLDGLDDLPESEDLEKH